MRTNLDQTLILHTPDEIWRNEGFLEVLDEVKVNCKLDLHPSKNVVICCGKSGNFDLSIAYTKKSIIFSYINKFIFCGLYSCDSKKQSLYAKQLTPIDTLLEKAVALYERWLQPEVRLKF